ncbi:MAG: RidA family protein [Acidobacteria bacterium]|nr:RidA family protein [Acidobacteriota bacterium]
MTVEEKLRQMGLELPPAPAPVAAYVPCVRAGNLLFISGQIPKEKGELKYRGHVGSDLSVEEAAKAARLCALNALSQVKQELGDFTGLRRIVKVTGYVASASGFHDQPKVLDGASRFLEEVLGEKGKHARVTVGVNELPLNVAVEVEMIVEVEP